MNQQQNDIFAVYDNMQQYSTPTSNRSPPSNRGYGQHTLNRQTSRHFENYDPNSFHQIPPAFQSASRHDANRFEGMTAPTLQPSYALPYESNTWNMGNGMPHTHHSINGMGSQMPMGMGLGSATLGASSRIKPQGSRRAPLPTQWMDQQQQQQALTFDRNGPSQAYAGSSAQSYNGNSQTETDADGDGMEDLIPTAIVIKNIPFAVKKEQLTDIMSQKNLPLPYAFNYHFDAGVFRGLAFANFSSAEETREVIKVMNHMEISGRKLRVEYKKMLPVRERERIEREKRERRGQLEEQHRPIQSSGMLHNQTSMSSLTPNIPATSPSPVSMRSAQESEMSKDSLNMNDKTVLKYFTDLMLFIGDGTREVMIFPEDTPPDSRRIIHTLAHQKGLEHRSRGTGHQRQVVVSKTRTSTSPPIPAVPIGSMYNDYNRRGLNRAATTDFSSVTRGANQDYHTLERQSSFLDIPNSPSNGFGRQNLREAKSFADLRSHSGSPSLLTSNFPPMPNTSRYTEVGNLSGGQTATPTLTPTSSGTLVHDDLVGPLNVMSLGYSNERSSANRSNGRLNMDRDNYSAATSVIGSHRPSNGTYEDQSRNGTSMVPERQPRLPAWNTNFSARDRQNGLGGRGDSEIDRNGSTNGWDDTRS